jgi:hypothetical protein
MSKGGGTTTFGGEALLLLNDEALGSDDHLLIHTICVPEIDSLVDALVQATWQMPKIHVVLRRNPDELAVRAGPRGGIGGPFQRVRNNARLIQLIRLYNDTKELAALYRKIANSLPSMLYPFLIVCRQGCLLSCRKRDLSRSLSIYAMPGGRKGSTFYLPCRDCLILLTKQTPSA